MTVTQLAAALNTAYLNVLAESQVNPTADAATMPVTNIATANVGYVCGQGATTVVVFLGGDPNVTLT